MLPAIIITHKNKERMPSKPIIQIIKGQASISYRFVVSKLKSSNTGLVETKWLAYAIACI